ncbi:MAG: YlxR family protein [Actinomycetota bacterium]|nr:YlxR family protein [Actinomycetota bacterium]
MGAGSSGDAIRRDDALGLDQGPVRMCIGCRTREPASNLVRLVADADARGGCVVDHERIRPGRGAHIHPRAECIEQAAKRRALPRALRTPSGVGLDILQVRAEILG